MKFHSIVATQNWSRWMSVTAAFALLAFIGCGSMDGGGAGGGCTPPPSNQNDNVAGNDNTTGNDNEPAGNDNTTGNDNEPVDNENDNEPVDNDNTGGGGGNDNQSGSNDNEEPGNDNDVNNNDNEDDNVNDNTSTNGNANGNSNSNVNGNGNVNANSNSGGGGGGGGGANEPLETKTSGDERACAAAPAVCDTVTLSLGDNVTDAACFQSVQWVQVASDAIQVVLTPGTMGRATFSVPRVNQVTTSVDLHFTVTSTGCSEGTMGTANVSIQVANATWVGVPTCIEVGDVIDINEPTIAVVTGQPTQSLVLVTVEGLTNEDDFNPVSGILMPTAGAGTTVTARLQVFGTAGLLDEVEQDIMIMATCP